jgi:hypothetical protein
MDPEIKKLLAEELDDQEEVPMDIWERLRSLYNSGHPKFISLCLREMDLHAKKNHDYSGGRGHDPLGNFRRVAKILSMYQGLQLQNPEVVAITYLLKQLDAILHLLSNGHHVRVEGIDDRLRDIAVYTKLIQIILDETDGAK